MAKTIKTVEIDGFSIDVDTNVFQDYEFLEALSEVTDGQPSSIVRPFRMLFTGDTYQAVKDHLRDEDGRVPVKAMSVFLSKVVKATVPKS
nr:MAG TPA: hypothetical protein [Caudoviricetes sp.]